MNNTKKVVAVVRAILFALFELLLLRIAQMSYSIVQNLSNISCKALNYVKKKTSPQSQIQGVCSTLFESMHDVKARDIADIMSDHIATDSGVYFDEDITLERRCKSSMRKIQRKEREKKEFPPPLSTLVQTKNLMPRTCCKFTKSYLDGRLFMKDIRTSERYEYFKTSRNSGRLVLNLVSLEKVNYPSYSTGNVDEKELGEMMKMKNDQPTFRLYTMNMPNEDDTMVKTLHGEDGLEGIPCIAA